MAVPSTPLAAGATMQKRARISTIPEMMTLIIEQCKHADVLSMRNVNADFSAWCVGA